MIHKQALLLDASKSARKAGNSDVWLFLAALFGFGGILFAILIEVAKPQWCGFLFTGCLGLTFTLAAAGWVVGLLCSIVDRKERRIATRSQLFAQILFIWNLCGCTLSSFGYPVFVLLNIFNCNHA